MLKNIKKLCDSEYCLITLCILMPLQPLGCRPIQFYIFMWIHYIPKLPLHFLVASSLRASGGGSWWSLLPQIQETHVSSNSKITLHPSSLKNDCVWLSIAPEVSMATAWMKTVGRTRRKYFMDFLSSAWEPTQL